MHYDDPIKPMLLHGVPYWEAEAAPPTRCPSSSSRRTYSIRSPSSALSSSGNAAEAPWEEEEEEEEVVTTRLRYCDACQQYMPDRSFHCTLCHRCVFLFDHHCDFTNTCVGQMNYKIFFAFLFHSFVHALLSCGGTVLEMFFFPTPMTTTTNTYPIFSSRSRFFFLVPLFLIALAAAAFCLFMLLKCVLWGFHYGLTTEEYDRWIKEVERFLLRERMGRGKGGGRPGTHHHHPPPQKKGEEEKTHSHGIAVPAGPPPPPLSPSPSVRLLRTTPHPEAPSAAPLSTLSPTSFTLLKGVDVEEEEEESGEEGTFPMGLRHENDSPDDRTPQTKRKDDVFGFSSPPPPPPLPSSATTPGRRFFFFSLSGLTCGGLVSLPSFLWPPRYPSYLYRNETAECRAERVRGFRRAVLGEDGRWWEMLWPSPPRVVSVAPVHTQ